MFSLQTIGYSQENSKGLRLKVTYLNSIQKNGQTSWKLKAEFTNKTKDTLFYFNYPNCEQAHFMVMAYDDTTQLFSDFESCKEDQLIITAIPPKQHRTIELLISSKKPATTPIKFKVLLMLNRANNSHDQTPKNDLNNFTLMKKTKRHMLIVSNRIKS
jgi:hypothetical protein